MGTEVPHLQSALKESAHGGHCSRDETPAMRHETIARKQAVVMFALLAVPARGRPVCSAFSSPELRLSSIGRLPRRSKEDLTMVMRRSTSRKNGSLGSTARGNKIRSLWLTGRAERAICGAVGDGNNGDDAGGLTDDDDDEQQDSDEDDVPMFSFAAVEDELQSRSAVKTAAPGSGAGDGVDGESGWLPRFFPPREDGDVVQPLVELPLDGVLLQLFPALLIGVVGLFLTIAVQLEASRFDGMVGDDGGAVVVTDLRDTTTEQQP